MKLGWLAPGAYCLFSPGALQGHGQAGVSKGLVLRFGAKSSSPSALSGTCTHRRTKRWRGKRLLTCCPSCAWEKVIHDQATTEADSSPVYPGGAWSRFDTQSAGRREPEFLSACLEIHAEQKRPTAPEIMALRPSQKVPTVGRANFIREIPLHTRTGKKKARHVSSGSHHTLRIRASHHVYFPYATSDQRDPVFRPLSLEGRGGLPALINRNKTVTDLRMKGPVGNHSEFLANSRRASERTRQVVLFFAGVVVFRRI